MALFSFSTAVFWAGSAGCANDWPDAAGLATITAPVQELKVTGAILTVVGSLSAVSREQAAVLSRERVMVRMDIPAVMPIEGEGHHDWKPHQVRQIGRASCRERVCQYVLSPVVHGKLKQQISPKH